MEEAILPNVRSYRQMKAKNVALGFWWAWFPLFGCWVIAPGHHTDAALFRVAFLTIFILAFALLYPFTSRLLWFLANKYTFASGCLLLSGTTLLAAFSGFGLIAPLFLILSVIVSAAVAAVVFYGCIIMLRYVATPETATMSILLMFALSAGVSLLVSGAYLVSPWVSIVIVALCPFLLYVTMPVEIGCGIAPEQRGMDDSFQPSRFSDASDAETVRPKDTEQVVWHYRHPIAVAFAVTGVCMGFALQYLLGSFPVAETGIFTAIGMAVVVVGLIVYLHLKKKEINTFVSARLVFPWFMIVVMALPFVPLQYYGILAVVTIAVWTLNTVINMDVAFEVIKQLNVSTFAAFGQIALLKYAGIAFGALLAWVCASVLPALFVPLVFVMSILLATVVSFLLPDKTTLPAWRLRESGLYRSEDQLLNACAELASEYLLTPREVDVLALLIKGRNARYIARDLTISETTAKTHVRNIYAKMGVNSHQMLLDVFEKISAL